MRGRSRRLAVPRPVRLPACLALALGLVLGPPAARTAAGQASDPDPERVRLLHEASDRHVVAVDGGGGELRLGAADEPGSVFELIVLEEAGDAATDVVALGTGDGIHFVRFPGDGRVDARATIQAGDPRLELESVPIGGSERIHLSHGGHYLQVISGELRAVPLSSEPRDLSEAERVASAFRLEPANRGTDGARRRSRPSAADARPAIEDLVGRDIEDRIRQPAVEPGVPAADADDAPAREEEEADPREVPALRAPRARAPVRLVPPAPPPTEAAFTPDGGWVIVRGEKSFARDIPDEAYRKLHEFLDAGESIDAIAFTPDGGWTIVAGQRSWTRNVKGDYHETVQNLHAAGGIRVLDVAFNPDDWQSNRGFVLVYDAGNGETGFIASGIPREMQRKMEEFTADGTTIDAVAFTSEGGWTIVADQKRWTRNVGGPSPNYYETLEALIEDGARLQAVAFNPTGFERQKGYVILAASRYRARGIPAEMAREIEATLGYDGR